MVTGVSNCEEDLARGRRKRIIWSSRSEEEGEEVEVGKKLEIERGEGKRFTRRVGRGREVETDGRGGEK